MVVDWCQTDTYGPVPRSDGGVQARRRAGPTVRSRDTKTWHAVRALHFSVTLEF